MSIHDWSSESLKRVRRRFLLDTGVCLVAERGYESLSFRSLAGFAGTSTSPFTHEFRTKDLYMQALASHCAGILLPEEEINQSGLDPFWKLFYTYEGLVDFDEKPSPYIRCYYDMRRASLWSPDVRKAIEEKESSTRLMVIGLIREAQEEGSVPDYHDPRQLTEKLWALAEGISTLRRHARPGEWESEEMKEIWVDCFRHLVGALPDRRRGRKSREAIRPRQPDPSSEELRAYLSGSWPALEGKPAASP